MSLKNLSDQHFTNTGGIMRCNLPGIVFVMFKADSSEPCRQSLPLFQQMSQRDNRLTWAVLDVNNFRDIIGIARNTQTPIKAVPMFVLYVNSKPLYNYKGNRTYDGFKNFLDKMLNQINQQQNFIQPQSQTHGSVYLPSESKNERQIQLTEEVMNNPHVRPHDAPWKTL